MSEDKPNRLYIRNAGMKKSASEGSAPSQLYIRQSAENTSRLYIRQSEPTPAPVQPEPAIIPYGHVILGLDTDTGQPVTVSQLDLCSGTYIEGVHGMGKS